MTAAPRRLRARVEGTVQGVGFRPYVYGLARELGLGGFVLNDERGVLVEVEGEPRAVGAFVDRVGAEAPPLAAVERVASVEILPSGESEFRIAASERDGEPDALVSADAATCTDCLAELFDPRDRRHRYPFTNCTGCGPRFTIVRGVPYDRPLTTMAGFAMCELCRAEYEDPSDRRFHAQPNACPDCGPQVRLVAPDGKRLAERDDAVRGAAEALGGGRVVAVKGVGGYHLACLAADERATETLRARKHREQKPFALIAPDLESARALVELSAAEEELLVGRRRPILIAPRRAGARIAEAVAPGTRELGVMLPYSPLHHLLARDVGDPLVMTSGNRADEPIAYEDDDALARLGGIADLILVGERPIHMRTDDSVLRAHRAGGEAPLLLRRSRGYVPEALELPRPAARPALACGAELKSTFCLARGTRAWVGHHIGDLEDLETLRAFTGGIEHFQRLFSLEPELVAHDLHPDYLSTKYALERAGVELIGVQHHHAHLAACLAEHGEGGPALGAIFDGTGYGPDGTVWGGELLAGGLLGFERVGALWPVRLPGGAAAIREPWRMACSWLVESTGSERPALPPSLEGEVEPLAWRRVCELVRTGLSAPTTTSVGRLFDAVAALCGLRARVSYEGQAAVELEAAADPAEGGAYELPVVELEGLERLDAREVVRAVLAELEAGAPVGTVSARFHSGLARATARACAAAAGRHGLESVVLSGGVFQNRLLLERTSTALRELGLRVLFPQRLPPNDGGISYGQAAVAAAREAR